MDGTLHTADHGLRLSEVALGVPGSMRQRHVHLACPQTPPTHVVLDYRVSALEPVLVSEPLEDALGGVTLLPGAATVLFQDPVDHTPVRVNLRPARRRTAPVSGRDRVLQHLAHCVSVQPEHARRLACAHPIDHAGPAHPRVHLHLVHPSHLPSSWVQLYGRWRVVWFCSATSRRRHPPTRSIITPPFTCYRQPGKDIGQWPSLLSRGVQYLLYAQLATLILEQLPNGRSCFLHGGLGCAPDFGKDQAEAGASLAGREPVPCGKQIRRGIC